MPSTRALSSGGWRSAALGAAFASEACFAPLLVRGARSGTILDGQTGAPIAGATVCVETWRVGGLPSNIAPARLDDAIAVVSDSTGHYAVESMREWHLGLPFPDAGPAWFPRLIVSRSGYASRVIDSWQRAWWIEGIVPEPIMLAPSAAEQPVVPSCPTARTVEEMPAESRQPRKR
jgi:hypothetical protein